MLPSAGITRHQRYYHPFQFPPAPPPEVTLRPLPSPATGLPPITRITFLACRAHYPGGPERVHSSVTPPFHAAFP